SGADFDTLSTGGIISGTLTLTGDSRSLDAADGRTDGFATIPLNVYSPETGSGGGAQVQLATSATTTSGSFQIQGLDDGTYSLYAYQPGFGLNPPGQTSVVVSNKSGTINITLEQFTGRITGHITLPTGQTDYNTVEIDAL